MSSKTVLKEAFEPEQQYGAFYTGGFIDWTRDGKELICPDQRKLNVVDVDSGKVVRTLCTSEDSGLEDSDEDGDLIYAFAVNNQDSEILTAHRSGLLKLWNKADGALIRMWKSIHEGPIARVVFSGSDDLIATGGCDSSVRVWNYKNKVCMANLKGSQGVVAVVAFHGEDMLYGAGDDNKILAWNYASPGRTVVATLEGHLAKITSICVTHNDRYLVSTGRDKVVILWDVKKMESVKTIPVYETIECGVVLSPSCILPNKISLDPEGIYVAIGGESGVVKVWEMTKGRLMYTQENSLISKATGEETGGLAIVQLKYNSTTNQVAVVSVDHNILIHNLKTFFCSKQLVGYSDEILDVAFVGKKDRFLAVATNSADIKLYDTTTMNCVILKGHTDTVMALSGHKQMLLSASKDHSVRLWLIEATDTVQVRCLAIGTKHTSSVGSVAMGRTANTAICASVSQDTCLKVWRLPKLVAERDEDAVPLLCTGTQIAHEKEINCVTIAPNDKMIATASQDKTAKVWDASDLKLQITLRGHKRGIWCVRFAPVDQVLLTTSADCTMRLWTIAGDCLKSFNCDEAAVLRGEFITNGMQILSAGSDGLIKVWNLKTSCCAVTLDKHEGRIWTLAVAANESYFYSGGADSQLIRWRDVTDERKSDAARERQEVVLHEQELSNLLRQNKLLKALKLALRLEKPHLSLRIINDVIKRQDEAGLTATIEGLSTAQKEALLGHATTWNTNSRNTRPAQLVIRILMDQVLMDDFRPSSGLGKSVGELLPYTERHFNRLTEFLKDLQFIDFTLHAMQPGN